VIPDKYGYLEQADKGVYWGYTGDRFSRDSRCCLVDRTGRELTKAACLNGTDFKDGYAYVLWDDAIQPSIAKKPRGLTLLFMNIDTSGHLISFPNLMPLGEIAEGLAPAFNNKQWGMVDMMGNWVIEPRFALVAHFSEGLAAVKLQVRKPGPEEKENWEAGQLWGYIDRTGKLVVPAVFSDVLYFHAGHAVVEYQGKYGMIAKP
jgi:hypothetical protein